MNGHENCKIVVFSNKAYNAIISETLRKDPVETGGILMGKVLSNGCWIVMEVIPPGLNAIHQRAYFEYDTEFVNYMAHSVSKQYKIELDVLGLWHRHPGSMDVFSGTDDGTNATFANLSAYGAISGLVNIDPTFRFTLRHVSYPLDYQIVEVEVGDDLIPKQYFELKYSYDDNFSLSASAADESSAKIQVAEPVKQGENAIENDETVKSNDGNATEVLKGGDVPFFNPDDYVSKKKIRNVVKKSLLVVITLALCLVIGYCIGSRGESKDGAGERIENAAAPSGKTNARIGSAETATMPSTPTVAETMSEACETTIADESEKGTTKQDTPKEGGLTNGTN